MRLKLAPLPFRAQVFRDKEGKAVSREELEAARKAELEKKAKERETPEWAAGLRQQRDAAERRAAMAAEAAKPFARSKCAAYKPWQRPGTERVVAS